MAVLQQLAGISNKMIGTTNGIFITTDLARMHAVENTILWALATHLLPVQYGMPAIETKFHLTSIIVKSSKTHQKQGRYFCANSQSDDITSKQIVAKLA